MLENYLCNRFIQLFLLGMQIICLLDLSFSPADKQDLSVPCEHKLDKRRGHICLKRRKKHGLHIMDGCSHSDIDSDFSEACILAARMLGGVVVCLFFACFCAKGVLLWGKNSAVLNDRLSLSS